MKRLIKCSIRYLKSVYWYIQTLVYSKSYQTDESYENVYVICPGPSLSDFEKRDFPKNTIIIFVNHAAKISNEFNSDKLLFTADTTRAIECLEYESSLKKIILIGHFFQLKSRVIKNYEFIVPMVTFHLKYGIVGKPTKEITYQNLGGNYGVGFGSFLNALSFSIRFKPKTLNLVGCDFGEKKDNKYAFNFKGINSNTPFSDIFNQYLRLEKILIEKGIIINRL